MGTDSEKQELVMQNQLTESPISPLVAIYMITYNHELYIDEAIRSVMMQQTNFPFTLFIGEDASKDGTAIRCRKWKDEFPWKIDLECNETNVGASRNAIKTFQRALRSKAKYVAILEGDDYWIDPLKLQKQVNYMEAHPNCSLSFGNAIFMYNGSLSDNAYIKDSMPKQIALKDLIFFRYVPTASVVVRATSMSIDWEILGSNSLSGDIVIVLTALQNGYGYYFGETFSVYRTGHTSLTSEIDDVSQYIRRWLPTLNELIQQSHGRNKTILKHYAATQHERQSNIYLKRSEIVNAFSHAVHSLWLWPFRKLKEYKDFYYRVFKY